jgi:phosphotransferase system enzyme I (PtsI)
MFPMIATLDDWNLCETVLQRALASLGMQTCPIPVGMMVEVPSAVFLAPELAHHAQFFSIGTNDLIQYLFAADRSVSALGSYYRPGDPALVRALKQILEAAKRANIPVGLCGEMAGDTTYTALLLALGLREFSVSAALVPIVKSLITTLAVKDCVVSYREMIDVPSI